MNELSTSTKVPFYSQLNTESGRLWSKKSSVVDTQYGQYLAEKHTPVDSESQTPPLVIEFGLGRQIDSQVAQNIIKSIKSELPSTAIYAIEPRRQSHDQERSVLGHIAVLDALNIDEFDSLGMSFGGYETIEKAAKIGDRALHVVTFSAIGMLEAPSYRSKDTLRGLLRSEINEEYSDDRIRRITRTASRFGDTALWLSGCVRRPKNTLAQLDIICNSKLDEHIENLDKNTHLTMAIGALDPVSHPYGTDRLIKSHREKAGEKMAQMIVVRGISHSLTAEAPTISHVVAAVIHGRELSPIMDLVGDCKKMERVPRTDMSGGLAFA